MKPLRDAIADYLALRRSLGFKLRATAAHLIDFASFLEQKAAPYITTALALEWAMQHVDHQPCIWAQRLGFVRVFARHWEVLQVWRFDLISWADAPRPIDFRTV